MTATSIISPRQFQILVLSIVCAAGGYIGFSLWSGWNDVSQALRQVGIGGVLLALLMSLANYSVRFIRWQLYLDALGHRLPWLRSLKIYLAGFALTTTPGKAGEALRGVLLKPHGVPYPQSFAAFLSERLSDLLAIIILTLFGLTRYPDLQWLVLTGAVAVLLSLLLMSHKGILLSLYAHLHEHPHKLLRIAGLVVSVLLHAQRCHGVRLLLFATVLSCIAWFAEALAFYWILGWMGADITLAFACFVYAVAMLAGALSFMPGGLGGAEAVMLMLLVWSGMDTPAALAATVLIRLTTLWFAVVIGVVALTRFGKSNRL